MDEFSLHQGVKQVKRGGVVVEERFNANDPEFGLVFFLIKNQVNSKVSEQLTDLETFSELPAEAHDLFVGQRLLGKGAGDRPEGLGENFFISGKEFEVPIGFDAKGDTGKGEAFFPTGGMGLNNAALFNKSAHILFVGAVESGHGDN